MQKRRETESLPGATTGKDEDEGDDQLALAKRCLLPPYLLSIFFVLFCSSPYSLRIVLFFFSCWFVAPCMCFQVSFRSSCIFPFFSLFFFFVFLFWFLGSLSVSCIFCLFSSSSARGLLCFFEKKQGNESLLPWFLSVPPLLRMKEMVIKA